MTKREGAGGAGGRAEGRAEGAGGAGGRAEGRAEGAGGRAEGGQPSEEELRAALEEELKRITVADVLVQTVVSLLNIGGRKAGLAPGAEGERDLAQVQTAIDGVRALLPLVQRSGATGDQDLRPIRDALSQLQLAYAKLSGEGGGAPPGAEPKGEQALTERERSEAEDREKPGPAQSSGRLWVPGQ